MTEEYLNCIFELALIVRETLHPDAQRKIDDLLERLAIEAQRIEGE